MKEISDFLKTSLLGGAVVLLPVALLIMISSWVLGVITAAITPISNLLINNAHFTAVAAHALVLFTLLALCFLVGFFVRTRLGSLIFDTIEERMLKVAPGYSLIKETVMQLIGTKKSPFSSVALVRLYGSTALTTAFITDRHGDGSCTVFVPTAPNPTSGLIFHLKATDVFPVEASVEETMRSVISCGVGSSRILRGKFPEA